MIATGVWELRPTPDRRDLLPEGDAYILNGEKLWCTNGTMAELMVVMARDPRTKKISAFVVEKAWAGVTIEGRCRFMGLRAIENGVIRFWNVRAPRENLIGEEGKGARRRFSRVNPRATTGGDLNRQVFAA